jgi:hypothetical protein
MLQEMRQHIDQDVKMPESAANPQPTIANDLNR